MAAPIISPVVEDKSIHPVLKPRHGATDVLRIAAVMPIVFYHAGVLAELPALIGMHALIVAAVVFAARPSKVTPGQIVARRGVRLLVPWAFYASYFLAGAIKNHNVRPWMFFIGGSVYLWFVPFIFLVTCGVALACRRRPLPKSIPTMLAFSAAALLLIYAEARWTPATRDLVPACQFLDGLTGVAVALAALSTPGGAAARLMTATALAVLSVSAWLPWRTPGMMAVSPAGFGAMIFLLVSMLPAGTNRLTDFLGRASFGLYLMHMVVMLTLSRIVARIERTTVIDLPHRDVVLAAAVTIGICLAAIAVLERTPARRAVT